MQQMFIIRGLLTYSNAMALSLVILVAITVLSLLPLSQLPEVSGGDKLHHLVAYFCLVLPVVSVRPRSALWLVPAAVAWGGAIELLQPYVNRWAEWSDFSINTLGVLLAWWVGTGLSARYAMHDDAR